VLGLFPSLDACLVGLRTAYPDDATRRSVCATLARAGRGDTANGGAFSHAHVHVDGAANVQRGPGWALIRNVKGTRPGVNANGQWKTPEAIQDGWRSFDGVPVVYGHPPGDLVADPRSAAGVTVNTRLVGDVVTHDLLLFLEHAPKGYSTPREDLERNAAFADLIEAGVPVHVSEGYLAWERAATGVGPGQDGQPRPYTAVQERLLGDHLAILSPLVGGPGACPVPACGAGVDSMQPNQQQQQEPPPQGDPKADSLAERIACALRKGLKIEAQPGADGASGAGNATTLKAEDVQRLAADAAAKAVDAALRKRFVGADEEKPVDVAKVAADAAKAAVDTAFKGLNAELTAALKPLGDSVEQLKKQRDEEAKQRTDAANSEYAALLAKTAQLTLGVDAKDEAKMKAEVARLSGLFPNKAGLDAYAGSLVEGGLVDTTLLSGSRAAADANDPYLVSSEGATVRDWSKVPAQAINDPFRAKPMGVSK
jgi:hypothetical protein